MQGLRIPEDSVQREHDLELTAERRIERLGHAAWPLTPLGEIEPRVDAIGEVIGLSGPELIEDGTIKVNFRLQDGYDRAKVQPAYNGGPSKITRSIAEGARVKVSMHYLAFGVGNYNST